MQPQGYVVIGTKLDTKGIKDDVMTVEQFLMKTEEKLGRKLTQAERNQAMDYYYTIRTNFETLANSIEGGVNKISAGLGKTVRTVGRWALAIFGVRSAFMLVRSAMNTISQKDEQLKSDIDYIKNVLAYTLEPVIRRIVELAKQLLLYIGYLIKSWTGYDIFENANKNLKKATGSAKELKKQLAGFDEMNVLSDTSGGGGGATTEMNLEGFEPPKWLEKIKDIGEWILENWEDVVAVLLLVKLFFDILSGNVLGIIIDLIGLIIVLFFKLKSAIQEIAENWKASWELIAPFIKDKVIKPLGDWFSNLWGKIKDGVSNATQSVKDKFNSIKDFFRNIINTIIGFFRDVGTKVGDVIGGAFKSVINSVLKAVENILNYPIRQINSLIKTINKIPGINLGTLSTFSLPRLAKGGIVNMPGRGVPIGSAIAGERGAEGVIPLTDSQQMALLGEAIGKHVTINATIPVYAYNREVDRKIKRIKAEDDFAYNR